MGSFLVRGNRREEERGGFDESGLTKNVEERHAIGYTNAKI